MGGTELPCKREIGNAHDLFPWLLVLVCFSSASVTLAFAYDTADTDNKVMLCIVMALLAKTIITLPKILNGYPVTSTR